MTVTPEMQSTASAGGFRSNVNSAPSGAKHLVDDTGELDESAVAALIRFFQTLDRWDLEAKQNGKIM